MDISVIGAGPGDPRSLTDEAFETLRAARLIIGAKRVVDSLPPELPGRREAAVVPADICKIIGENPGFSPVCVVMSGDTGFYSGARKLLPLLEGHRVTLLPGLSTVQILAARLGRPWQDLRLVSAHGTNCNVIGNVLAADETFFLTGGTVTPQSMIERLTEAGMGEVLLTVAENLSYPEERITTDKAENLLGQDFAPLSAVWAQNTLPRRKILTGGLADGEFIRGQIPMTKQEVRAAVLSKLCPGENHVIYDVGAGTGSVGIELSLLSPMIRVYAVECQENALGLMAKNRQHFGAYNLKIVPGRAPEALDSLPAPDCAFIGGSRGNLREIIEALLAKNPAVHVVISAIALETLGQALEILKEPRFTDLSVSQISVSRGETLGGYSMMKGQNPIYLLSAKGGLAP